MLQDTTLDGARTVAEKILRAVREDCDATLSIGIAHLSHEELAWLLPVWPQGMALLRLATRDGLVLEDGLEVPGVPPVIRVPNPYVYYPDAWRSIDFQPRR